MNQIIPFPATTSILHREYDNKNYRHRLGKFLSWLDTPERSWQSPNLTAYRDYLLHEGGANGKPLSPSTVSNHLATIRSRYRELLRDNSFRDYLYVQVHGSPADQKSMVDEITIRLQNAIDPQNSSVDIETEQDVEDDRFIRLSPEQALWLINRPLRIERQDIVAVRNSAILAIMLCTGVRENELCLMEGIDLRQSLGGFLALHVRHGKGRKKRLIPYGGLIWCLDYVDDWLRIAQINSGWVFRGFTKSLKPRQNHHLVGTTIQSILAQYPIDLNGEERQIRPHDLRRSYAKIWYDQAKGNEEERAALLAIQQNLGHARLETTLRYIGEIDADRRAPPDWR